MKQLLKWKKEYGYVLLIGVLLVLILANAAFSYRDLTRLVPMTTTMNQLPYQIGYPEEGADRGADGDHLDAVLPYHTVDVVLFISRDEPGGKRRLQRERLRHLYRHRGGPLPR